jgi:folate-binding protein YgfZ
MNPEPRSPIAAPGAPTSVVRLEGRDALEVLHRISTRELSDLAPGRCRAAPFCDYRGRLLHRAVAAATGDGAVWLLRDDGPGAELAAFIERHVFREDVRATDLGAWNAVRPVAPAAGPADGTVEEVDGIPVRVQPSGDFALALVPPDAPAATVDDERARILLGRPRHGHEIHPDFNPFEVGLAHEVHLDKGCFTGQEALMRLVTYGSVRRRLARLRGAGLPPGPPREVRSGGTPCGVLTSAAPDGAGGWIGLAVLARAACSPGARLEIEGVTRLGEPEPFPLTRPLGLA